MHVVILCDLQALFIRSFVPPPVEIGYEAEAEEAAMPIASSDGFVPGAVLPRPVRCEYILAVRPVGDKDGVHSVRIAVFDSENQAKINFMVMSFLC